MSSEHKAYDANFPERQLSALVLSKVFFHMEKWEDSIRLALIAGPLFDINDRSIFNQTILNKAIDSYVKEKAAGRPVDPALESIVEQMIKSCLEQGDFKQVIGIALDSCRLDVLKAALSAAQPVSEHLRYTQTQILSYGRSLAFQQQVLDLLISLAESQPEIDYVFICDCLVSTQDVPKCSAVLSNLLSQDGNKSLQAYQIAFNIYEVGPEFAQKVCADFVERARAQWPNWAESPGERLVGILSGCTPAALSVRFLAEGNSADMLILERSRATLSQQNSQHHSAIYWANALMQAGSTNDEFLRKNMDWLSHASNWAKFSAAASLGVIHTGHLDSGRTVLAPYLPKVGGGGSPYAEGGALFAMGLIHARASETTEGERQYLKDQLAAATHEAAQHGACLGLGTAAMASQDVSLLDDLRGILYGDNAVAGEGAALGIGLIMTGSRDAGLSEELLAYARETQHDKVIRALLLAVALIHYGALDTADGLVESLAGEKDASLRFGSVWTLAMAYAGTGDNGAVRRLLHAAVSESDDDVRRSAVTALGFVLFRSPGELPQLLELLSASYNPHVRYGVAMALGLAFCGTGDARALELVRPLWKDVCDFVRQGAYMASALILQEVSEAACDQVAPARKFFESVAGSRYEEPIARFGAILAQGIIDAGGRNAALALSAPGAPQHNSLFGICGSMLFCQFWYWYPCLAFLGLGLQPTGMLAVDGTLEPPVLSFCSAAPPHLFAYPEATKEAAAVAPKKLSTAAAVLSTTAKAAARAKKAGKMDVDEPDLGSTDALPMEEEPAAGAATTGVPEPIAEEPDHVIQDNFTRITVTQRRHIIFGPELRFQPVVQPWRPSVYTVVRDTKPAEPLQYLSPKAKEAAKDEAKPSTIAPTAEASKDVEMAAAPEPFEEPDI